jgi:hypothetical protein
MPARNLVRAVVVLSLLALGCNHGSSPSEPVRLDKLSLVSLSPAEGATLPYGSNIDVTARVHYSFSSAARGKVGLLVYPGTQLPTGLPVFATPFSFSVEGQEGEVTLHSTIFFNLSDPPLPKGSHITLNFALFPEGVNQTSIGFDAHYQVGS